MPYRIKYKGEKIMGTTPSVKQTAIKVDGVVHNFYSFRYFSNQLVDGSYFVSDEFFEKIKESVSDKMIWETEKVTTKEISVKMLA
jgi:hypothetical protein